MCSTFKTIPYVFINVIALPFFFKPNAFFTILCRVRKKKLNAAYNGQKSVFSSEIHALISNLHKKNVSYVPECVSVRFQSLYKDFVITLMRYKHVEKRRVHYLTLLLTKITQFRSQVRVYNRPAWSFITSRSDQLSSGQQICHKKQLKYIRIHLYIFYY